jgi:hypothetical protein
MRFGKVISSGLLVAVLLAPVLGMAICASASQQQACASHCCAMMRHMRGAGTTHNAPAPAKAPCCERKAPVPSATETAAQIVAPVQIALLPADTAVVLISTAHNQRVEIASTPPSLASPLLLLCTLLI